MSTITKTLIYLAASATVSWGTVGIAIADAPTFYEVRLHSNPPDTVENAAQQNRLKKFVQRLHAELMVDNLGDADIGCDRCGELVESESVEGLPKQNRPLVSLKFALTRYPSQLEAFVRSYDFVQGSELGAATFEMEIDGTIPISPSCSATQISWGCKTRQACFQTGGCDKPYGGSCDLCTQP